MRRVGSPARASIRRVVIRRQENCRANQMTRRGPVNRKLIAIGAGIAAVVMARVAAGEPAKESQGPGLVEIMMATQSHHAKLWLAGSASNWDLADYQIDELKEGLEDAAKGISDYKGVPIGRMIENLMMPPIAEVENSIKAKDR